MLGNHPSIVVPQNTEYAKELCKWNATHTMYGPPLRPYVFREYPKALYKVEHKAGDGMQVTDRHEVENADQERHFNSRGYYELAEAGRRAELAHTEHGKLAAEREYEIRHGRLSDRAVAEVRRAEAEYGTAHLPVVPETPIPAHKKRGRKPKTEVVA